MLKASKRFLWLTENYPPQRGGMAQSCDRIVNGLREKGFQIEIIHFTNDVRPTRRKEQMNGGYSFVGFDSSEAHTLNLTWSYVKTLGAFDACICFGGYLCMLAAPIFSKWMDCQLYTFLRGNDFDNAIFNPKRKQVLVDALAESDRVFSVSNEKAEKVKKWMPSVEVQYVPNGIDLSAWRSSESDTSFAQNWRNTNAQGKRCLGLIGQLKAKKGLGFFLSSLLKTKLTSDLHLILVGEMEERSEEELQKSELSYTLLPFKDRYELIPYYLCCDALCIPSFYDGMPNVMLEAGALAVPIMASKVDGMADVIEHEKHGWLFPPGDVDVCRKSLYQFAESSTNELRKMGQNLRNRIEENYTVQHEMDAYEKWMG